MIEAEGDVAVLGAGFGGSLTARLLKQIGLRPILIDRSRHPRFAIGESSTPIADLVLRDLARRYDLPRLEPLTHYGSWRETYPQVIRGPKRGFSYFRHERGEAFAPTNDHTNELLVAASSDDWHSDTHWLRSSVDHFFAAEAASAGVPYLDQTEITSAFHDGWWYLTGLRESEPVRITARFLIDATGEAQRLPRTLGIADQSHRLHTHSRAIFAHFEEVTPWHDLFSAAGGHVEDHPFCCDHAALHQMFDDGWMWQLRFDNGVTSAGFALDTRRCPLDSEVSPQEEWHALLARFPSIEAQFRGARIVAPAGGLRRAGRLQRRAAQAADVHWALLPNTAGFIDPLHSSGIAQTLCGVERLVGILERHWDRETLPQELASYSETVLAEIDLIDRLVATCYAALPQFPLFVTATMLYFVAATTYEHRRIEHRLPHGAAFLCADDPALRRLLESLAERIAAQVEQPARSAGEHSAEIARAIQPYNIAGLCDPAARNMYRYTAVPIEDSPRV